MPEMGLKAVRRERDLTCEQIGLLADADKSTVSRYERGLSTMRPESIVRLSKALKVSVARLTTGNGQ